MKITAVDIGGSHITVAAVDMESRTCNGGSRMQVDSRSPAGEILDCWAAAIARCAETHDGTQIAVAMPGPFDYASGVCRVRDQSKFDALYGVNVKDALAERLQIDAGNILFDNDATCFLRGHYFAGCFQQNVNVLGLTLGTGFGSVIRTGEGYFSPDYWCRSFGDSMADDYFSSRWLLHAFAALGGEKLTSVRELATRGNSGEVFRKFGANLAGFLSEAAPEVDAILLGGNIAKAYPLFGDALEAGLAAVGRQYRFQVSALGEEGILLGAAALREKEPVGSER